MLLLLKSAREIRDLQLAVQNSLDEAKNHKKQKDKKRTSPNSRKRNSKQSNSNKALTNAA